jgi:HD superfamily phosphodiesterase
MSSLFAALGNIHDTGEVQSRVNEIVHEFAPAHDLERVNSAFMLLDQAFAGNLPGYEKLKTPYHNRMHTNEVVLCSARMLHGLHLSGKGLDDEHIDAALLGALMHDVGYLMRHEEASGTGAQFTDTHVVRGVDFAREQLSDLPANVMDALIKVIQLTDHRKPANLVSFDNAQQRRAAYATASADLIGQMANRAYLERLSLLYLEFLEANFTGFNDFHELLEKTAGFYQLTNARLAHELGGLSPVLARHFSAQEGMERNFYLESIDSNLLYLQSIIREDRSRRLELLRRGGMTKEVLAYRD